MSVTVPVPTSPPARGVHPLTLLAWAAVLTFAVAWVSTFGIVWPTLRRLGEHWPLALLHLVLLLTVAGVLGRGLGLPELFRIDASRPGRLRWLRPFAAGFGAATFIAGSQVAVYFIDLVNHDEYQLNRDEYRLVRVPVWAQDPPERLPAFVVIGATPILAVLLLTVAFPLHGRRSRLAETAVYLGASVAALAAFVAVTWLFGRVLAPERSVDSEVDSARRGRIERRDIHVPERSVDNENEVDLVTAFLFKNGERRDQSLKIVSIWVSLAVVVVVGVVAVLALRGDLLSPGLGLTLLFSAAACLYFFVSILKPEYQPLFLLLLAALVVASNLPPFRYRYPAVTAGGGDPAVIDPYVENGQVTLPQYADPESFGAARLDEADVLTAWRARHAENPHLVLLAVSGGAYRAGFWVGSVLDALDADARLAGLTDNIRMVTGASGGMVGASYHVALRHRHPEAAGRPKVVDAMLADTGGDSLTRVVRQLLRRDLPFLFWPLVRHQRHDRGIELERHWATIDLPFQELAKGEGEGRLPSLVITPTLVETGRPLYVSNLRLGWLAGYPESDQGPRDWFRRQGLEFFGLFPGADRFNVQTAVRMNAAFPFVSPAVKLPTDPTLRVVDAGYLDNYGLGTAASWLHHHREWIVRNTTGVTVLVMRAFAETPPPAGGGFLGRVREAFQWLSSPLEAAVSARGNRMQHQTGELMRLARSALTTAWQDLTPEEQKVAPGFTDLDVIDFAYPGEAAMNWFISRETITDMAADLTRSKNAEQLGRLAERWNRTRSAPTG